MSTAHLTMKERHWLTRRRRLQVNALLFSPLVGFPIAFLVGVLGPMLLVAAISVISVISGIVLGLCVQLARCPHCGRLFYAIPGRWHFLWHTRNCRHCGFPRATDQERDACV
jgi:hypothetical protein